MRITVKLFAQFRLERFKVKEFDIVAGTVCSEVVAQVGIEESELGVVMVNSRHAQLTQQLNPGDSLALFPLVGGG